MSSYGNFNVKPFEDLKERATKIFSEIIENITTVKDQCAAMSDIVISEDSKLGSRWRDISEKMEQPIQTIEDTVWVVQALLDAYINNTLENEEEATKELEIIDEGISTLTERAETLLSGLTALKGIGFGATAIAIPGLMANGYAATAEGELQAVEKYAPPTVEVEGELQAVEKYAPPTVEVEEELQAVEKYAPPAFTEVEPVEKYAPPTISEEIVAVEKYAPPTFTEMQGEITGGEGEISPVPFDYVDATLIGDEKPDGKLYTAVTETKPIKLKGEKVSGTGSYQEVSDSHRLKMDGSLKKANSTDSFYKSVNSTYSTKKAYTIDGERVYSNKKG